MENQTTTTSSPVGTFKGTVEMPGMVAELELRLTGDGKALLTTPEGGGKGTWKSTGDGTFNFQIIEYFPGGRIRISQDGRLTDDGFTSSGTSKVYDQDGVFLQSVNPKVTAVRVSAQ